MKRKTLLVVGLVLSVVLALFSLAFQVETPVDPGQLFVGALLALAVMGVKAIAFVNPNWNPPAGWFGKLQYILAAILAVVGPLAVILGISDDLGVFFSEGANIINAFTYFVGVVIASGGLFELFNRLLRGRLSFTPAA